MNKEATGILFFLIGFSFGCMIFAFKTQKCKPVTIVEVIRDTTEANLYRRMAETQRQRADSLQGLKQQVKIKYEIIYKYLDAAPMPVVDSVIRANAMRHD